MQDSTLYDAARRGNLDTIKLLIENGVNPKLYPGILTNSRGIEITELLLKSGADPNAMLDGRLPLNTQLKSPKIIELLLKNGADPNKPNKEGETPLVYLCKYPYLEGEENTELLLKYGADPNLESNGEAPFEVLISDISDQDSYETYVNMTKLFVKYGLKDNPKKSYRTRIPLGVIYDTLKESNFKFNVVPEKNLKIQGNTYSFNHNNQIFDVHFLPNSIIIQSDFTRYTFKVKDNQVKLKGDDQFINCVGITLLLHNNYITLDTLVDGILVSEFSKNCKNVSIKTFKQKHKNQVISFQKIAIPYFSSKINIESMFNSQQIENTSRKISVMINVPNIDNSKTLYSFFVQEQRDYIAGLSFLDQCTIKTYTYTGDSLVNDFIKGKPFDGIYNRFIEVSQNRVYKTEFTLPFVSQIVKIYYPGQILNKELYLKILNEMSLIDKKTFKLILNQFVSEFKTIINNAPPLKFNLKLYRGVKDSYFETFKTNKKDIYYKLNQFTSTTIDVNVATNYTEKGEWNDEPDDITQTQEYCCLLQILALKGTRLLYNNSVSNFLKDHEVNINIDSRYLIKGNTQLYLDNGIYYTTDIVIVK
jgi:hypothetical protein